MLRNSLLKDWGPNVSTIVTRYLDSKKIDYQIDGNNALFNCPFCDDSERKFGINLNNWLGQCFKGKCSTKVNEKTFKRKYGDTVEQKSNLEDDDDTPARVTPKVSKPETIPDWEAQHQKLLEDDAVMNYLNDDRGLSIETIKEAKLGIGLRKFGDGPVKSLTFPYFSKGKCTGIKYKALAPAPKDFRFTAGAKPGLYMVDRIVKDIESLIIVEGELDLLILQQHGYLNVVAVSGAAAKDADWAVLLDLPKKLTLILDNDAAGELGAKEFAKRFGIDRINIVNMPHYDLDVPIMDKGVLRTTTNDINEFFQIGRTKEEFDELLASARPFDIEGASTMDAAFDKLIAQFESTGTISYPYEFKWPSITARAKGVKPGDLIVILAAAKVGKTTFCLNQADFMQQQYGCRVHFSCLEMDDDELTRKWTAMTLQKAEDSITIADIRLGKKINMDRGNSFIYTRPFPSSLEDFTEGLDKVQMRYNTNVKVIDNFQALVDQTIGRGKDNNRPNYMSRVSKILKASAKKWGPTFLISQPRGIAEGAMVTVNDSEGSTTLTKDADLFFTMNRNPEVKMKMSDMASLGKFETHQSHSETVYIDLGLSRRSSGGISTLKIDGATSTFREFDSTETTAGQKKAMIAGIGFVDDNETTAV